MLRRKLKERQKEDITFPLNSGEFFSRLDTGPLTEMHNAIYFFITNLHLLISTDTQQHHTLKLQSYGL